MGPSFTVLFSAILLPNQGNAWGSLRSVLLLNDLTVNAILGFLRDQFPSVQARDNSYRLRLNLLDLLNRSFDLNEGFS
jgi:hypothetical protein